jgi:hypothetical protein
LVNRIQHDEATFSSYKLIDEYHKSLHEHPP